MVAVLPVGWRRVKDRTQFQAAEASQAPRGGGRVAGNWCLGCASVHCGIPGRVREEDSRFVKTLIPAILSPQLSPRDLRLQMETRNTVCVNGVVKSILNRSDIKTSATSQEMCNATNEGLNDLHAAHGDCQREVVHEACPSIDGLYFYRVG